MIIYGGICPMLLGQKFFNFDISGLQNILTEARFL